MSHVNLDMSLDDIISKAPSGGKGKGASRVQSSRIGRRASAAPYAGGRGGGRGGGGRGGGGMAFQSSGVHGGGGATTSVYVGNLSWDVTWQDLKDHFKQAGAVGPLPRIKPETRKVK